MAGAGARKSRRRLLLVAQVLVSVALLAGLILAYWEDLLTALETLSLTALLVATAVLAMSQVFGGLRLWVLSRGGTGRMSAAGAVRLTFAGFFVGNFLPSTVGGDLLRGAVMARDGFPVADAAVLLVADRVLNTLVVLVLAAVSLPLAAGLAEVTQGYLLLMAVAVAVALLPTICAGWIANLMERTAARRPGRLGRLFGLVASALRRWPRRPRRLLAVLALSLAGVGASLAAQWWLVQELSLGISPVELIAVACLVYLVTLLPISLNGIGVQEASLTGLLTALGVEGGEAFAFAVAVRIIMIGTSIIGGGMLAMPYTVKGSRSRG